MKNPRTPEEWQEAVDLANFGLIVDAARQYGLITGGPVFALKRCNDLLARGAKKGFRPQKGSEDKLLREFSA